MRGEGWDCGSARVARGWAEGQLPQLCPAAGKSTLAIMTFARYEWFEEWKDKQVTKRGDDYEELKKTFVDTAMQAVFKLYPRIKDRVRKPGVCGSFTSSPGSCPPSPVLQMQELGLGLLDTRAAPHQPIATAS